MKRKFKNRKGTSPIIEMIFALPLIIGILFTIINVGFLFNQYLAINNAAREAVRTLCIQAGNPHMSGNTVMQMVDSTVKGQLKGTAVNCNKLIENMKFVRIEKWENGGYRPDNMDVTASNVSYLHFHDKILVKVEYPTTFNTVFFGVYHPTLHAESEYLVEYFY